MCEPAWPGFCVWAATGECGEGRGDMRSDEVVLGEALALAWDAAGGRDGDLRR